MTDPKDTNGDGTINLVEQVDAHTTDIDALNGRVDTLENTVKAMADAFAAMTPENAANVAADVADIKTRTNEFYKRVYGDVLFPTPPTPS